MDGLSERRTAQLPQAWVDRALNFAEIRSGEDTIMFWATVDSAGRAAAWAKGLFHHDRRLPSSNGRTTRPADRPEDDHRPRALRHPGDEVGGSPMIRIAKVRSLEPWRAADFTRCFSWTFSSAWPRRLHMCWIGALVRRRGGAHTRDAVSDKRYRTRMMWWDRRTFVNHAEPEQVSKILMEIMALANSWQQSDRISAHEGRACCDRISITRSVVAQGFSTPTMPTTVAS